MTEFNMVPDHSVRDAANLAIQLECPSVVRRQRGQPAVQHPLLVAQGWPHHFAQCQTH